MQIPKQFSTFIVEDEPHTCSMLVNYASAIPELKLIGFAANGHDALRAFEGNPCDVLLLDINLPDISGMELARKMLEFKGDLVIIIISAHIEHSIAAFEIGVVDYLPKPISFARFEIAMRRAIQQLSKSGLSPEKPAIAQGPKVLSIREKLNLFVIPHKDIIYLTSHGRRSTVHTKNREYNTGAQLKALIAKLPANQFSRIHKQYAVNMNFVSHLQYNMGGSYILFLKNDANLTLPVGVRFASILKERLGMST